VGLKHPEEMRDKIIELLRKNFSLFAWTLADMPGVDPNFCCYQLSLFPGYKLVAQKKHIMGNDRQEVIEK